MGKLGVREKSLIHQTPLQKTTPIATPGFGTGFVPFGNVEPDDPEQGVPGVTANFNPGGSTPPTGAAGGDLAGTYPNPTVFQAHLTDQAIPATPASGTLVLYSYNQQGFSVPHVQDPQGDAVEITRDNIAVVRNITGSTIAKGTPVYRTGSTGTVSTVAPAKADSGTTMPAIGIMYDTTVSPGYGRVMYLGHVENINLSAFANGNTLYVSATVAGGLTATAPTTYPQVMGTVINNGVGNGVMSVHPNTQSIYNIPLTSLATQSDGTVVGNFSGGTTVPSANTPDSAKIQRTYYAGSTSGTSTYTATLAPVPTAYVTGSQYVVTVTSANTGASTMNFNGLGAKTMQLNGAALAAGQLQAGATYQMVYDGANLQISGQASSSSFPAGTFGQQIYYSGTNAVAAANQNSLRYGWADSDDLVIQPFNTATNAFGVTLNTKTCYTLTGSGGGFSVAGEKGHPGMWTANAGITNGSGRVVLNFANNAFAGGNGNIYLDNGGGSDIVWTIKTDATLSNGTTRYVLQGGWSDSTFFGGRTNGAGWSYTDNVNAGVFRISVTSGSAAQPDVVGTTTVQASTWYRLRINIDSAYSTIKLYISVGTVSGGTTTWGAEYLDATYTGTMPLTSAFYVGTMSINKTLGTGNSAVIVDGWEAAIYTATTRGG